MTTTITTLADIKKDTRAVCVFCYTERYEDESGYCCGENGAVMLRADFFDYMGFDFFADED